MSIYGMGLGIVSIMILFGIIMSGTFMQAEKNYSADINDIVITLDSTMEKIDMNVTNSIDQSFNDMNVSSGIKKAAHYMTKGIIYGIYLDLAVGQAINEYMPGIYKWIIENIYLVVVLIIILIYPDVVSLVIWCIFALILIIKERYFDKPKERINEWWEK